MEKCEYHGMCGTCRCDFGWPCFFGKPPAGCRDDGCVPPANVERGVIGKHVGLWSQRTEFKSQRSTLPLSSNGMDGRFSTFRVEFDSPLGHQNHKEVVQ